MKGTLLGRGVAAFAAISLLCGCGFSNSVPLTAANAGAPTEKASSEALLYVANTNVAHGVDILTFPKGKPVGKILNIGYPRGVCADRLGHVWITAYISRRNFALYEFARGTTTPLRTVRRKIWLGTCTVNPDGNLVVFSVKNNGAGAVEVWPPSLQGKPHVTDIPMYAASGAYNPGGDLYLRGYSGSDPAFGVLPKGRNKLTWLLLKKADDIVAGCLGWDGNYLTLSADNRGSVIYRLTIDGKIGKVAAIVRMRNLAPVAQYALTGREIVATRGSDGKHIGLYHYPAGGEPIAVFSGFDKPLQIAISSP